MRWSSAAGSEIIARHPRSYERDDFVYDPIHYLPLLEQKIGALDQAAPLQEWELPDEFGDTAPVAGVPHGTAGQAGVRAGAAAAWRPSPKRRCTQPSGTPSRLGAISFDAVKHLVLCRLEGRPPHLDLELYPYLPRVHMVSTTSSTEIT